MSDEVRVLPANPTTVVANWRLSGTSTAPSDPTAIIITDPAGLPLAGAPTVAGSTGNLALPGEVAFTFPGQPDCTLCRVVWSATVGGALRSMTSYVEVVGEHLFDIADLRAFEWGGFTQGAAPLADPARYPTEQLMRYRDQIADEIEEYTHTSPMERYTRAVLHPNAGSRRLLLDAYHPRRVLSLKNGTAIWASTLTDELQLGITVIEHPYRAFADPVTFEYVRGLSKVPATISEAAKKIAIMKARPSTVPPRAISITDERGTMQLAVANYEKRRYYGVPEIDTALQTIDETAMQSV